MHQKHPPAKYALSKFGEFAKLVDESNKTIIDKDFFIRGSYLVYSYLNFYDLNLNSIFFDIYALLQNR
jgi:hypothetical protein